MCDRRLACRSDVQLAVEHQQRLANGINDAFAVGERVLQTGFRAFIDAVQHRGICEQTLQLRDASKQMVVTGGHVGTAHWDMLMGTSILSPFLLTNVACVLPL